MPDPLILAGAVGLMTAAASLWVQGRRRIDRRCFAGLVALAVSLSLFSIVAWAATEIVRVAPLPLTWGFVGALALLFALRLYRELEAPPSSGVR
jgi:hypothetical protein